jgi:hypothetical protein
MVKKHALDEWCKKIRRLQVKIKKLRKRLIHLLLDECRLQLEEISTKFALYSAVMGCDQILEPL